MVDLKTAMIGLIDRWMEDPCYSVPQRVIKRLGMEEAKVAWSYARTHAGPTGPVRPPNAPAIIPPSLRPDALGYHEDAESYAEDAWRYYLSLEVLGVLILMEPLEV